MLTRVQKEDQVTQLKDKVTQCNAMIAVEYRGMNVDDVNDLRTKLRAAETPIEYRVAKNTLMRLAIAGTDSAPIQDLLSGPTAIAFAFDEPAPMAKILVDFAKDCEALEIKGGVIEGEAADVAMIETLAALPTRDELRAMLAGTLQAPLRNLAGTLYGLLSHVRNALEERQAQLEEGA